ncbi:MAG: hypothetical protein KDH88_05445 [Chromatiales bacterium]|nr:hypothetical protein [Chromatiales bacterium]
MPQTSTPFSGLATNLAGGLRLCLFRSLAADRFRFGADTMALLLLFYLLASLATDYLALAPDAQFNTYAAQGQALRLGLLISALFIAWRSIAPPLRIDRALVVLLSPAPFFLVLEALLFRLYPDLTAQTYQLAEALLTAWWLGVQWWALFTLDPQVRRTTLRYLVYLLFAAVPQLWLDDFDYRFWLQPDEATENPTQQLANLLSPEQVYYQQPILLGQTLIRLAPERPGRRDLYFVGFGGWGDQDVFAKEVESASRVMSDRFTDDARIVRLENDPRRADTIPLASVSNLDSTLSHVGDLMDKDEDLLMLFLTSHGEPGRLGVQMGKLGLLSLHPEQLRIMLDESGIQWRIIVVSACYSGSFIDALRDENTVVLTASAADRVSNGCRDGNEYTHFGRALWAESMPKAGSLLAGLRGSIDAVKRREVAEGLEDSRPQLHIGSRIEHWLEDARLAQ